MDLTLWLAFAAASTALLLLPGPTVLLILSYAVGQGRRVAVPVAMGVAAGDFLAMTLSLAGLGALVMTSATLFSVLKWVGAVYLVWLGVGMIRGAGRARLTMDAAPEPIPAGQAFRSAMTVTALNPKTIAFFIAFAPQFIDPAGSFGGQAAILIATFCGLATLNSMAYALLAGSLRDRIRRPSVARWLARTGGATLVGMGVATAFLRRAPA